MAPIAHYADDHSTMKSLPSPTLTNPDMVLPNENRRFPTWSSPPRSTRRARPPSPSYLRDRSGDIPIVHNPSTLQPVPQQGKREKRGLMSRKMMLLRSRTASSGYEQQPNGSTTPTQEVRSYRQPPQLMDVGNLAPPEQVESAWSNDESSAESDDMSGLPQFLAKYNNGHTSGTDDELDGSTAVGHYDQPPSTFGGSEDAERRQKEKDEQNSAILSKRAEEILANAKKRLNLMEGNLRGARDLVAPLTAANLKRATSVASYVPPINNYGGINRYVEGNYRYDATTKQSYRPLHAQASNPVMGRDYQGHWRGFSDVQISDRPASALDRVSSPTNVKPHTPVRTAEPPRTKPLKGSRSHDSLAMRQPGSRDLFYSRNSPEQNLEPLVEDEDPEHVETPRKSTSSRADSREGSRRGVSSPEDLHEQMSSLKGRISALRERAREDSVRRQSMQNLREPSPLNNATSTAPEFFYQSSPTCGSPVLDTKAGVGHANPHSPDVDSAPSSISKTRPVGTGSRNAFAEQARRQQQRRQHAPTGSTDSSSASALWDRSPSKPQPTTSHTRTPSGTAIVQSSKHRYSHHQYNSSHGSADAFIAGNNDNAGTEIQDTAIGTAHDGSSRYGDDERSEFGGAKSIYEDAQPESQPAIVAHEDRDDAFDYENFFLHSAMSYYATDAPRRASTSAASDERSTDSMSTARGPAAVDVLAGYVDFDSDRDSYTNGYTPGPEPQTPERLREIERNLHRRTFSDESVESITSFATATEGLESPDRSSAISSSIQSGVSSAHISTAMEWPVPPADAASVGGLTPRPDNHGAIPAKAREIQISSPGGDSSSSERADSGLGLGLSGISKDGGVRRVYPGHQPPPPFTPASVSAPSKQTHKPSFSSSAAPPSNVVSLRPPWMNSPPLSPPNSPRAQDPAAVAVNALLVSGGRQLGLRDKALMFGLVESLKQVCRQLQEGDEAGLENRMLRRRLDDARRVLAGGSEVRPGTS